MRFDVWRRCSAVVVVCALTIFGQTKIDLRTQTKNADFSGAPSTKPAKIGSVVPATCGVGEFFFLTSAPAGQNVYACSATNVFTLQSGSIGNGNPFPTPTGNSGAVLGTDGRNALWQAFSGDVTGMPGSLRVGALLGRGLSTLAPADGQLLNYNGTTSLWQPLGLGGDISGAPAALKVGGLLGRALSNVAPTDGQLLKWNNTKLVWEPTALTGDVTGAPATLRVGGLLGRTLSGTAPNDGQVLKWNNTTQVWEPAVLTGDVTGVITSLRVGGLLGRALSTATPGDGQLLKWNNTSLVWEPVGLGGDVSGAPGSLKVGGLLGKALSAAAPLDGQLLKYNGTTSVWEPVAMGGDVSGAPASLRVGALLGRALNTVAPGDGQLLKYNGTTSVWEPVAIGGDISGAPASLKVGALLGRPLGSAIPADGQLLKYNGTTLVWEPVAIAGDVSGSPASLKVGALLGRALSTSAPADGQLLKYNGLTFVWEPVAMGGDVSGAPASLKVGALLGRALGTTAPVDGQLLKYNGVTSVWEPAAIGGDVSGAPASLKVGALQGRAVWSAAPSGGQLLAWNASNSAWTPTSLQSTPNFASAFASSSSLSIPGTQHNLGTANVIVSCYDNASPANQIEPSRVTVDPATYNVAVTFAAPQSGRCVVNGLGGQSTGSGVSMASQLGDLNVAATSGSTLTIGATCSVTTPCNSRFGTVTSSIASSSTVTISGGSGTAFVFLTNNGILNVASNGLTLACSSGCLVQSGISQFPVNSLPIFTWAAVSGAWTSGGGTDQRAFLSSKSLAAGTGIILADSGSASTISIDSTTVPKYLSNLAALSFPAIANAACGAELTISVPGALPGDGVAAGWPALPAGLLGLMRVSLNDTVAVRICNFSGTIATVTGLTYRATIVRGS